MTAHVGPFVSRLYHGTIMASIGSRQEIIDVEARSTGRLRHLQAHSAKSRGTVPLVFLQDRPAVQIIRIPISGHCSPGTSDEVGASSRKLPCRNSMKEIPMKQNGPNAAIKVKGRNIDLDEA